MIDNSSKIVVNEYVGPANHGKDLFYPFSLRELELNA